MTDVTCEFPDKIVPDKEVDAILKKAKRIAVVGISAKPDRDSYRVARYLKENGFELIPINPMLKEVLGEKAYPSLSDVPGKIDIVDIFRKPEAIAPIVDEAIKVKAAVIWMQLGLAHNESARKAEAHGLKVVQNKCLMIEHGRFKMI